MIWWPDVYLMVLIDGVEPDNVMDMSDMPTQTCPPPQSDTVQDLSPSMMEHLYENVEALSVDETYFDSEDDDG